MYTWLYDHFINTIIFPLTCLGIVSVMLSTYAYFTLRKTNK